MTTSTQQVQFQGRMRLLNVLVLLAILNNVSSSVQASPCPQGYYTNPRYTIDVRSILSKCLPCSRCSVGSGIQRPCGAWADTVCHLCDPGYTYSAGRGHRSYCRTCSKCGPHREVKSNCTTTRDTICGECEVGYYWDSIYNKCEKCSWCFPDLYKESDAYLVSTCMRPEIPKNFRCVKLVYSPYNPPVLSTRMLLTAEFHLNTEEEFSGNFASGSGDSDLEGITGSGDVAPANFPTDDEELSYTAVNSPKTRKNKDNSDTRSHTSAHTTKAPFSGDEIMEDKDNIEISTHSKHSSKYQEISTTTNSEVQRNPSNTELTKLSQESLKILLLEKVARAEKLSNNEDALDKQLQTEQTSLESKIADMRFITAVVVLCVLVVALISILVILLRRYTTSQARKRGHFTIGTSLTDPTNSDEESLLCNMKVSME